MRYAYILRNTPYYINYMVHIRLPKHAPYPLWMFIAGFDNLQHVRTQKGLIFYQKADFPYHNYTHVYIYICTTELAHQAFRSSFFIIISKTAFGVHVVLPWDLSYFVSIDRT